MWEKENQNKAIVFGLSNWKSVSSGEADRQEQLLRWKSAVGTFSLWVHLIINAPINEYSYFFLDKLLVISIGLMFFLTNQD